MTRRLAVVVAVLVVAGAGSPVSAAARAAAPSAWVVAGAADVCAAVEVVWPAVVGAAIAATVGAALVGAAVVETVGAVVVETVGAAVVETVGAVVVETELVETPAAAVVATVSTNCMKRLRVRASESSSETLVEKVPDAAVAAPAPCSVPSSLVIGSNPRSAASASGFASARPFAVTRSASRRCNSSALSSRSFLFSSTIAATVRDMLLFYL